MRTWFPRQLRSTSKIQQPAEGECPRRGGGYARRDCKRSERGRRCGKRPKPWHAPLQRRRRIRWPRGTTGARPVTNTRVKEAAKTRIVQEHEDNRDGEKNCESEHPVFHRHSRAISFRGAAS